MAKKRDRRRTVDPTPDEIERRAIEVQQQWSDRMRNSRAEGTRSDGWLPPFVSMPEVPVEIYEPDM